MSGELDGKAVMAAHEAYAKTTGGLLDGNPMANAIRAYLAASASLSMEPDAYVDWKSHCVFSADIIKDPTGLQPVWFADALSQAQSALAALSAQVQRLTEENEALRRDAAREAVIAAKLADADEILALQARIKAIEEALRGLLGIVDDSKGVTGYHLNGDIAEWDEFEEIEIARSALKENAL